MEQKQMIRQYCQQFNLTGVNMVIDELITDAQANALGYIDYTVSFLATEADYRRQRDIRKRLKTAALPKYCDLSAYDHSFSNGLTITRLRQLQELHWMDQIFNIILMGPSGTGKTFLSAGLCHEAVCKGYKAYFRTMDDLISTLKMKEVTSTAKAEYKRLLHAHLIVIDDIMMFPVEKKEAVLLFNFINQVYEKTSFIITTNKKPAEWALMLNDEVLATALLDRLLYQCEVINLSGKSYRLKNRKTIFEQNNN
ncbi:MAG: IS21-like element helper ATPase IstB [Comamonas sp.]